MNNEKLIKLPKQVEEITSQLDSITFEGVARFNVETNDDLAIERAITKLKSNGGGQLRINKQVEITKPIILNDNKISIFGVGETSVIKPISEIECCIEVDYNSLYGARGVNITNIFINCDNKAKHGLLLGRQNPVVQSIFSNVKIKNATDYGLVCDATQNSLFELVDVENCKGQLKLINGAGNNVFNKCEFNNSNGLSDIYVGKDINYNCYNHAIFDNVPQNNNFMNCVTERGIKKCCIEIEFGKFNNFYSHEIDSSGVINNAILLGSNSSYNRFNGRLSCGGNVVLPILNNGYNNKIYDTYIENNNHTNAISTSNVIIVENVEGNKEILVENTVGNIASNIVKDRNAVFSNNVNYNLSCGQFQFNDKDELYFRNKNIKQRILVGDIIETTKSATTTTTISESITVSSGVYELTIVARNDIATEVVVAKYFIAFRNSHICNIEEISKLSKAGVTITLPTPIITSGGVVTISATSSVQTNLYLKTKFIKIDNV